MPKLIDREPIEHKTLGCSLETYNRVMKIRRALEAKESDSRRVSIREAVDRIVAKVWKQYND